MLALTPLAACGMSVGDEQTPWGGQGPAPLATSTHGRRVGRRENPLAHASGHAPARHDEVLLRRGNLDLIAHQAKEKP